MWSKVPNGRIVGQACLRHEMYACSLGVMVRTPEGSNWGSIAFLSMLYLNNKMNIFLVLYVQ